MSRSPLVGLIVCLCWVVACQPGPVSPEPSEPPALPESPIPEAPAQPEEEEVLATVPGAPSAPSLRRWEQQVDVRWEAPATDGGRPVTGYRVTCSPGDIQRDVAAPAHALRLQGMPPGTPLVCTVRARNAVGEGAASAASGPEVAVSPPSAPLEVKAEPGEREVRVSWTAPREEGGEPVRGYLVESWPDGKVTRAVAASRWVTVVELPSTQAYTFTVSALNDVGQGPRSFSTLAVRPRPAPAVFSRTSLSGGAEGCASLQYVLRQPDGLPADVKIEVDRRLGLFRPVTQAGSTTHEGLLARGTSAQGTAHDFLWNRGADVPEAVTVRLRMSAQVAGAALASTTLTMSLPAVGGRCELSEDPGLVRSLDWKPHASALVDIDRDGKRDLVLLPDDGGPLRILQGLGHGGFLPAVGGYTRGDVARPALAAVDLDGDGWVELITSAMGGGVLVFKGRGEGLFEAFTHYSVGPPSSVNFQREQGLAVADFNGDGQPDVAVIAADGSLYLLYNVGGARLGSAVPARPAYYSPDTRLSVADINADGRADLLAVSSLWGTYATLRSQGDGSFVQDSAFDSDVGGVALGDFTGDGRVDLALAQDTDSGVRLWLRQGDGRGAFAGRVAVASWTGLPNAVKHQAPLAAADFDADGRLDVAVGLSETGQVAVRWGRGDGTFEPREALLVAGAPLAADVDSDGRMDLVTLESRAVSVRRGALRRSVLTPTPMVGQSAVGDLNADGWMDVVSASAHHNDTYITVSLGGPDGFTPQPPVEVGTGVNRVLVDRIDADGTLDVLAIGYGPEVTLLKGQGDGTLVLAGDIVVDTITPYIRVADVDADGSPDLLVSGHFSDPEEGRISMHAVLVRGQADGTFLPPSTLLASLDMSEQNIPVEVGDVNGDGHLDVVVPMTHWNHDGQILLGQGDGTFHWGATIQCGMYPVAKLTLADLDGDKALDVVCSANDDRPSGRRFVLLKGSGQGTFAPLGEVATGRCCLRSMVVDFDGDGHVDVLGHGVHSSDITVVRGLGGGRFALTDLLETGMTTRELSVLDADRDGLLDLLLNERAEPNVLLRQE